MQASCPAAITAIVFVSWAEGLGFRFPDPMKDGARRYVGMAERNQVGRQTATADHGEVPDAAKAETQPLREELTSPASASAAAPAIVRRRSRTKSRNPLSPRVHNSLLKMVIGMAMDATSTIRLPHAPTPSAPSRAISRSSASALIPTLCVITSRKRASSYLMDARNLEQEPFNQNGEAASTVRSWMRLRQPGKLDARQPAEKAARILYEYLSRRPMHLPEITVASSMA